MKYDILIAGVGGQGILSLAYVLDHAAMDLGLHFKQNEVHGMAQRGGGVVSHVRISPDPIHSDTIDIGGADVIISMEPLEALRYLQFLKPNGLIITNSEPFINIPNYPDIAKLKAAFAPYRHLLINAAELAKKVGNPNTQNMVLLGALSRHLDFPAETMSKWVQACFEAKGQKIMDLNLKAFESGRQQAG